MANLKQFGLVCVAYACFMSVGVSSLSTPALRSATEDHRETSTTATSIAKETANDDATELVLMKQFLKLHESECGFITLCSLSVQPNATGPRTVDDDPSTCCLPCSCDDACEIAGTCCPDYDMYKLLDNATFGSSVEEFLLAYENFARDNMGNDAEDEDALEANDQAVGGTKDNRARPGIAASSDDETPTECVRLQLNPVDIVSPSGQDYKIANSCPSQYTEQRVRFLCESPSYSTIRIPVYSRKTRKTYKNINCLQCNTLYDKADIIFWQPVLECKQHTLGRPYFRNIDAIAEFISSHNTRCDVVYEPADESIQVERCTLITQSSCRVTTHDEGDTGDEELANLPQVCQRFYAPVTRHYLERQTYRNIACFYCSRTNKDPDFAHACRDVTRTWPKFSIQISVPPMLILVGGSSKSDEVLDGISDSSNTCPPGYVFHIICRKVLCPRGFFIENRRCKPLYGQVTGMMTFQSMLLVQVTEETRRSTGQQIADIIERAFAEIFKTVKGGVQLANLSFGIFENKKGHFYIFFRFTCENNACYFPETVMHVKYVVETLSRHPAISTTILEQANWQNGVKEEIRLYDLATHDQLAVHKPFLTNILPGVPMIITKANFCNRIKLERDEIEFKSFLFAELTASKKRIQHDDIDRDESDDRVVICMDTMWSQKRAKGKQTPGMNDDADNNVVDPKMDTSTERNSDVEKDIFSDDFERGLSVAGACLGLAIGVAIVRIVAKRSINAQHASP